MNLEALYEIALTVQKHFPKFYLAGGTALTFRYRHRESVDLDFFHPDFSLNRMTSRVKRTLEVSDIWIEGDSVNCVYRGVKVSFVCFPFKNIEPLEDLKGLKMASDLDIFLNKLYATGRRIEWKDAFDIAYLYKRHRWDVAYLREKFERKFLGQDFFIFVGSAASVDDYPELPNWCIEELRRLFTETCKLWFKSPDARSDFPAP